MNISDLPLELIENILALSDPISVARFSETCRSYFQLVYGSEDQLLWRTLFLSEGYFDDPRKCANSLGEPLLPGNSPFDWKSELKRRVRAQTIISNPTRCRSEAELLQILTTLVSMVLDTPIASHQYTTDEISRNVVWLTSRRELGDFLEHLYARRPKLSHAVRQRTAQLHTFVGHTSLDFSSARHAATRAFVYDFANYSDEGGWGPYASNGEEVNWEHVLAVQHVMGMHVVAPEDASPQGSQVLSLLPYCQAQLPKRGVEGDWAGVDGTWSCSFCFVDHRELLSYNATTPRDTALFTRPDFIEVFRSFRIQVQFTGTEPDPRHPTRPTIKFKGRVHNVHTMVGTVRVAEDGTVRWSFTSGEETQMIWSSEGVQIGVAQSTFGVLGTWSTVFHDDGDPVGPFWLRKELDDEVVQVNVW